MKKLFLLCLVCFLAKGLFAQVLNPDNFLGYKLGTQFTLHKEVVSYFEFCANNSPNMKLVKYGETYEGRSLVAGIVSSRENILNIEEIRKQNLALTGLGNKIKGNKQPVILWLSYNVHGNEASSTETALKMLYTLLNPTPEIAEWLKNVVVIIDPCLNPDGRDRYVNFYKSNSGSYPNPNPAAIEHQESWPGGRTNHFYFDLNRDWVWQTQKESQVRVAFYQQWMPQIHIDYHEQNYNEPYYFAPAAEPIHKEITNWQREAQNLIGRNNAKYFDSNGWKYFTKEKFDLLYPAYGDTYPLYNGAIGMTYEQGGIRAGLSVLTNDGDTLTLTDRINHHFTTGIASLEFAATHKDKIVSEFQFFFDNSSKLPDRKYKTYVIKPTNLERLKSLIELLKRNDIQYSFGGSEFLSGYNYETKKTTQFKLSRNDLIINLQQRKAVLANVLLEPNTYVSDSTTYDITAWALPYIYGLEAYALKNSVNGEYAALEIDKQKQIKIDNAYAWAIEWNGLKAAKALNYFQSIGMKIRIADEKFTSQGKIFNEGTLLIYRTENQKIKNLESIFDFVNNAYNVVFTPIISGYVDEGKDLGSSVYRLLIAPKIAIASGDGVFSTAVGEVWHLLDQEMEIPYVLLNQQNLGFLDVQKINVLILPSGNYSDKLADQISPWISAGGKLILLDDAIFSFIGKKQFDIKLKEQIKIKKDEEIAPLYVYRNHYNLNDEISGAIFKIQLDKSHPLSFGLNNNFYSLKTDDKVYEPLQKGFNIGVLNATSYVSGIAGENILKKIQDGVLISSQKINKGLVIYLASNVLFRAFWESGKQMLINGLFIVN